MQFYALTHIEQINKCFYRNKNKIFKIFKYHLLIQYRELCYICSTSKFVLSLQLVSKPKCFPLPSPILNWDVFTNNFLYALTFITFLYDIQSYKRTSNLSNSSWFYNNFGEFSPWLPCQQSPLYFNHNNPTLSNPPLAPFWDERFGRSNGYLYELIVHIFQTYHPPPPFF